MSRANQFSTHKSISIRETDDNISMVKSNHKRIDTELDKHQITSPDNLHSIKNKPTSNLQAIGKLSESPY